MKKILIFTVATLLLACLVSVVFYTIDKSIFILVDGVGGSIITDLFTFTILPFMVVMAYVYVTAPKIRMIIIKEIVVLFIVYLFAFLYLFSTDVPNIHLFYRMSLVLVFGSLGIKFSYLILKKKSKKTETKSEGT